MSDFTEIDDVPDDIAAPAGAEPAGAAPMAVRDSADGYALFALVFAIVGFFIPVLPAAAALMLVRATESEHRSERTAKMAGSAATIAYLDLAFHIAICVALLLGIAAKVVTS